MFEETKCFVSLINMLQCLYKILLKFVTQADKLWVQGGGLVHAVKVTIVAGTLVVDDLGQIVGDLHDISCPTGTGFAGNGGSGKYYLWNFLVHVFRI